MADSNKDVEVGGTTTPPPEEAADGAQVSPDNITLTNLDDFEGKDTTEKFQALLQGRDVVIVGKSWCPFTIDAASFLSQEIGVKVHVLNVDTLTGGAAILSAVTKQYEHNTVPLVFVKTKFYGGCDDIKALHVKGTLERDVLDGLINRPLTAGTDQLATAVLLPPPRGKAIHPLFWFPNTVNNRVVRMTGLLVCVISIISAVFALAGTDNLVNIARWLAVFLLIDFGIRFVSGSPLSPLGMIATVLTSPFEPNFRPGPPKQFASFCGLFFSLTATIFYFVDFKHHDIVGAVWIAMLAGAAGMEAILDFCLGCVFYGFGIQFGLIPDHVYRIYTASREEIVESWKYQNRESNAPQPVRMITDPKSPIALKYKKKTDEWTKDDFDAVRHMQVAYFGMPLSLAGLAVAFKVASRWSSLVAPLKRSIVVPEEWFQAISAISATFFVFFGMLYLVRVIMYPHKCWTEWSSPIMSSNFGTITITLMLYGYLVYDQINTSLLTEDPPQILGRVLFWVGAVGHALLTVSKTGEWIGRRLELEHIQPTWMIMPVGLAVAALIAPLVGPFAADNDNSEGNIMIARFFFSFSWLMWITLFTITFFKVVTTHNSDDRLRHGVFVWLAAPCVIGLADFVICTGSNLPGESCRASFANYYFIGVFLFLSICWATLPTLGFFCQDKFGMGYWIECFALDTLAACACLFYTVTGWRSSENVQFIFLAIASIANFTALLHTATAIIRRRGVFTPEVKWGPLSFMKLTHEAFRGNMVCLKHYIQVADVEDYSMSGKERLGLFAAHFNRFCILHDEHSKHEDEIIFKTFNDYFPAHAKKYNDDHEEDHIKLDNWRGLADQLLDISLTPPLRRAALDQLREELPAFFVHFEKHMKGEEDHLQPIARKVIPLELQKQISRKVWELTPAEKWEVIVPFIVTNLPRHQQRVRYLKVLCWSMPERAQQIGAIVYRNVDAVMWERLRVELPEIIPRGAPGWKRYY